MSKTPIFAVEQGCYSDYSVRGVFSTKEAAERVCERYNVDLSHEMDRATVAEWVLDPAVDEMNAGMEVFLVRMFSDGSVEHAEQYKGGFEAENEFSLCNPSWRFQADERKRQFLVATVWATDQQHAIKIVNERRGQMIAMGEWEIAA